MKKNLLVGSSNTDLEHAPTALSVRKMGAQNSIPRREVTEAFLKDQIKNR
jgi:hypothetical protein